MTQEEKAKAYDEAVIRGSRLWESDSITRENYEYIFPELKESKDERIRKELIEFVKSRGGFKQEYIAWLEKQGEHAKFRDSIQVGDKVTRNRDGVLVNLSQLKRVAKPSHDIDTEKQGKNNMGISKATKQKLEDNLNKALEKETPESFNKFLDEQKPTDKVEPKFKVGDWVVYCNNDVDLITGIEENGYSINNSGYIPFVCASDVRLWTIQDAKDGDVLVGGEQLFLFKRMNTSNSFDAHCNYHFIGYDSLSVYDCSYSIDNIYPATKEQRDLLFKKMKESGYMWDAEKKELKKIEKKFNEWSEEDEKMLKVCTELVGSTICANYGEEDGVTIESCRNWLKNWTKEDKERYISCLQKLSTGNPEQSETINSKWFKEHVYPQSQWKPSEEQIKALSYYLKNDIDNDGVFGSQLVKLYQDLKKLREE